jgi:imidazole glycerol-phosphate synthase subunit HisH
LIAIVDYGIGNIGSVVKAFKYLNIPVKLTYKHNEIKDADAIVLPGVGAFGEGMNNLKKRKLDSLIKNLIFQGKPFLGICLGLQLLFSSSEEDKSIEGLNIIEGEVRRFNSEKVGKIPHIGWNQLKLKRDDPLFYNILNPIDFYFVHSYYVKPIKEEFILANTNYGKQEFVSVIRRDNVWGIQCHPEKSSRIGLQLLRNFSEVVDKWK